MGLSNHRMVKQKGMQSACYLCFLPLNSSLFVSTKTPMVNLRGDRLDYLDIVLRLIELGTAEVTFQMILLHQGWRIALAVMVQLRLVLVTTALITPVFQEQSTLSCRNASPQQYLLHSQN
jgi:hypothetical protein